MVNQDTLIEHLRDFKNTDKYSTKQLAEFLYKNPVTSDFYKYHVKQIQSYIKSHTKTLYKYSKDRDLCSFTNEEVKIINLINENHLITFGVLELERNGFNVINSGGMRMRFAIRTLLYKESISDLIEHIIKFCVLTSYETMSNNIKLTPTEKIVLEYINEGVLVPQIAEEMNCSKHTIENHKKNICKKIDALDKEEYKGKTALAKLRILASKIFK